MDILSYPTTPLTASFKHKALAFIKPAKTSREVFTQKDTYILSITVNDITGVGECSPLWSLSIDPKESYTSKLQWVCDQINNGKPIEASELKKYPSILFGLESALLDLKNGGRRIYFPSQFTERKKQIKINGLIWMGDFEYMKSQIQQKLKEGFSCVKLKIGAIEWEKEISLISFIRENFGPEKIELRVDANGAFAIDTALSKLKELKALDIHSIEQPIPAGNWNSMAKLCSESPLNIALDEELIGVSTRKEKEELLQTIRPAYIILKPSLIGGISGSEEWIEIAESLNIKWWLTSALEGNIGLNVLAQYIATKNNPLPQGLGTGALYSNNFPSALKLDGEWLSFKV